MSDDARADLAVVRAERKAGAERANFAQAIWGWHPCSVLWSPSERGSVDGVGINAGLEPLLVNGLECRAKGIPQGCWRSYACDHEPRRLPGFVLRAARSERSRPATCPPRRRQGPVEIQTHLTHPNSPTNSPLIPREKILKINNLRDSRYKR